MIEVNQCEQDLERFFRYSFVSAKKHNVLEDNEMGILRMFIAGSIKRILRDLNINMS